MIVQVSPILFGMYLLLLVFCFFCSNSKQEIRVVGLNCRWKLGNIVAIFLLIFFLVLIFLDRDNPDYLAYSRIYYSGELSFESGYHTLQAIFIKLNISFDVFKVIVYGLGFSSIWHFYTKLGINKNYVWALYAFFPFTYDAIQMRNFLAFAIIMYFLPNLIEGKKRGILLFILGVTLAGTIHSLSFVYLIFLLANYDEENHLLDRKKVLIFLFVVSLICLVTFKFYSPARSILIYYFNILTDDSRAIYYTRNIMNWGFLGYIFIELLFIGSIIFCKRALGNNKDRKLYDQFYKPVNSIFWLNISISMCFSLLLLGGELYRIYRNVAIINYATFAISSKCSKSIDKYISMIMTILAVLISGIWQFNTDSWQRVFWIFFN